jgi:hypothetical protein
LLNEKTRAIWGIIVGIVLAAGWEWEVDMSEVKSLLERIRLGPARTFHNLTVYPLQIANGHMPGYVTLDDALAEKQLEVSEVSEGGSVPDLHVRNRGKMPVLMVLGEELIGAKQDRTLNTDVLVPATSELNIPVSCVEAGRWSYRSRRFTTSDTTSTSKLRAMQLRHTTKSLMVGAGHRADQRRVWGEVGRSMGAHNAFSATSAMKEIYDQMSDRMKGYTEALSDLGKAHGALVLIDGKVVGVDVFDHPETFGKLWPKLARAYALDALETAGEEQAPTDPEVATGFLERAKSAREEDFDAVGLGSDVRLASEEVNGSALVWEGRVVHATLVPAKAV